MGDSPEYVEAIIRSVQELYPESQVVPDTPPGSQLQSSVRSFQIGSPKHQQRKRKSYSTQKMEREGVPVVNSQNDNIDATQNRPVVAHENPKVDATRKLFK
ncbi:hypothetical protein L1987_46548 [Smallanthus sonchifolius]|uniref:Uncharacterized protein n=1 Tax=Smallanthus sonchifolius TaxID=185202 RepID=A0ACB9FZR0_9ASTR|nr:hypothetical protein L1987_46548 [Smallanthus sonchifolius]